MVYRIDGRIGQQSGLDIDEIWVVFFFAVKKLSRFRNDDYEAPPKSVGCFTTASTALCVPNVRLMDAPCWEAEKGFW